MRKENNFYKFLFYRLYNWFENSPIVWMSEWKASYCVFLLQVFPILTFLFLIKFLIINDLDIASTKENWILGGAILMGYNYYIYHYKDRWRNIVKSMSSLSRKQYRNRSILVLIYICAVLGAFIFTFSLLFR